MPTSLSTFHPVHALARIAVLALAGLALGFASPAAAQPPPVPEDCDEQDSGTRIKCKYGNIIAQQRLATEMISFMPNVPESQKQALMNQVERSSRAQGRASDDDFKELTRRAKPKCQIAEVLGDGRGDDDGVCKGNEDCVEVLDDQIGDDDGICKPTKGKNREICVEICDEEGVNTDPENFDDDPTSSQGRDVEEQLEEITEQYVELNDMLDQELTLRKAARVLAANGDPCAAVITGRSDVNLFAFLTGVADGARMGADIAERFCDQSVFGANTAAVCSVIEGVAGVAMITRSIFEFEDAAVDSDTIDSTFACIKLLNTAVGQSNDDLALIQQDLNSVQIRLGGVEQQLATTIKLLKLPPGQREEFNE